MRKAIALILFLTISAVATANTSSTATAIDGRFKVSGRVIDESTLQPLPYAIVKVSNLDLWATTDGAHIEREVMLVKARCAGASRDEVMRMAEIYRGQIVDVTPELYTVQLVGSSDKLDAFLNTLAQVTDIVEVVRSGVCGIARGDRSLHA
jgi:acetolactate synthase-1/3 small subunit